MEWKVIQGFSNYEISNIGFVRNKKTGKILKNRKTKAGYYQVCLKEDRTQKFKNQYVHRLVALNFIPKGKNEKVEVNHIDGNKMNNSIENLEWVTHSENTIHRFRVCSNKTCQRRIGMFDRNNVLIKDFNSIVEAYQFLNKVSRVNIDNALQGKQKTAYGYFWKYLD